MHSRLEGIKEDEEVAKQAINFLCSFNVIPNFEKHKETHPSSLLQTQN